MRRRDLLRLTGAAAGGLSLGAAGLWPRAARAGSFGDAPAAASSLLLPPGERPTSILEIFLYGGLSPWESFYAVEGFGRPDDPDPARRNQFLYAFHNDSNTLLDEALAACGAPPPLFTPFATDAAGQTVCLGPFAAPLLARPDLLARMRVVVTRHDLTPHEAAIPLSLCGKRLGSPVAVSLGAHVQRYASEHGDPARAAPYAYSLATDFFPTDNLRATLATGAHPGSARPLLIKVDHIARLGQLLAREGLHDNLERLHHDLLLDEYGRQYGGRLAWPGKTASPRAHAFDEVVQSNRAVAGAESVRQLLDPQFFVGVSSTVCGASNLNTPAMSLRLAARLLTHPTTPAAHVCFVDGGLISADTGGGYDGHIEHCRTQSRNLKNTLDQLIALINAPGEKDPSKIDLDRTMIILGTEFGRTPGIQGKAGRNHWPQGYVQVYLGGPITPARAGVFGAIDQDGQATTATTPAEHRIASLLALGIWPFSSEAFGVSDVPGAQTELDAATLAFSRVLGVSA
jgi:hypothetical protein